MLWEFGPCLEGRIRPVLRAGQKKLSKAKAAGSKFHLKFNGIGVIKFPPKGKAVKPGPGIKGHT